MNKRMFLVLGLVALLLVVGAGAALAQGNQDRFAGRGANEGFVDADGDGLCDLCGETAQMGGRMRGMRGNAQSGLGYGVGRDPAWHEVNLVTIVAETLEISEDDVRAALAEGQTFAEIIDAKGGEEQDVVDAYVAARTELLNQYVADGKLTQEQADAMLANMAEEVAEHLQSGANCGVGGGWNSGTAQRGGRMGGRGMMGGARGGRGYNGNCPVQPTN